VIDRDKQIARDEYYMSVAKAIEVGADCYGTKVGALVVLKNRIVSTGYNGTPEGFTNCEDDGCVRCRDRWLEKQGRAAEMTDPTHTEGRSLDRCICVHAEQNAFLTAARFGIGLDGGVLYTTQSPCFNCLKEAVQAGIERVVYGSWYRAKYSPSLVQQYRALCAHLSKGEPWQFEAVGGGQPSFEEGQPDPYLESDRESVPLDPPSANG
jgi:dCMP deaminase